MKAPPALGVFLSVVVVLDYPAFGQEGSNGSLQRSIRGPEARADSNAGDTLVRKMFTRRLCFTHELSSIRQPTRRQVFFDWVRKST